MTARNRNDIQKDLVKTVAAKARLEADLAALEAREKSLAEQAAEALLSGTSPFQVKDLSEVRASLDATRAALPLANARISQFQSELDDLERGLQVAKFHDIERDIDARILKARELMTSVNEQFSQVAALLPEASRTANFAGQDASIRVLAFGNLCSRWSSDLPQYQLLLGSVLKAN